VAVVAITPRVAHESDAGVELRFVEHRALSHRGSGHHELHDTVVERAGEHVIESGIELGTRQRFHPHTLADAHSRASDLFNAGDLRFR
jgi:hypothetical protein